MTYVDYLNRPAGSLSTVLNYTLWLPWTLKGRLENAVSGSSVPAGTTASGDPVIPTEDENEALESVANKISASVDEGTGLMTISVTTGGPQLAASLAESFLDHFTRRVREIRTEKVRERLEFVEGRFEEAEKELEKAEDRLAQFLEQNQNPTTASLQFRRDRLQRQVSFKEQLYSELQGQLTQTRLDLQRRQPVVTVVEEPVPPVNPSGIGLKTVLAFAIFAGGIVSVGIIFVRAYTTAVEERGPAHAARLEEIRNALRPDGALRRVRQIFRSEENP
jgi:uncharacterized protein involved in exopolysaccharide biosynthesis